MTDKSNYKIENIQRRELKLKAVQQEILSSDSEKALDLILDAPSPASLIQSFPDQDLYYLMHKIGSDDFIPILSLAKSEQWEYILDVDVWDNDRLDIESMTKAFDLLFQADPQRLLRWVITEKPDFFEFYLFKQMEIIVREHDEIPPEDFDDYITLDDKFYFRFPNKPKLEDDEMAKPGDSESAWELIEKMLKSVADMDLSVFHGVLLETKGLLTAETEEEQFRLKSLRLAEKGFLPTHEAIGIYQPTKLSDLRQRPSNALSETKSVDPELPLAPQFFSQFIQGDDLFINTLRLFSSKAMFILEVELAALINKVISADKIKIKSKGNMENAIFKTCDYINLGLEVILKENFKPEFAREVIEKHFLEDIFRTGSRAGIQLKTIANNWYQNSFLLKSKLPLSFLGETYLGTIGGLMLDRPLVYDKHAGSNLLRNFKTLFDIHTTDKVLSEVISLDMILSKLNIDVQSFEEGMLTYKTMILTLWARNRLNLENTLAPIEISKFKDFFTALFSESPPNQPGQLAHSDQSGESLQLSDLSIWVQETTQIDEDEIPVPFLNLLSELINELDEEYGTVNSNDIDPRYIPHFLLKDRT